MPWVSWDRLGLKGPEPQTSLWEQDCQHLLGWPLEQTLFRVKNRKGTVLDNEDSGYGKVNETQRQRWCLCAHTHTPYFHSEGVSESEGDKPYPRKTQVIPQGNHCHIPSTLVPKTSAAWWRLWRARSALTNPVHDNVHDRTSCAKTGRQEGP